MRIVTGLLPLLLVLPGCANRQVSVVAEQRMCPQPAVPPQDLMRPPEVMDFLSN